MIVLSDGDQTFFQADPSSERARRSSSPTFIIYSIAVGHGLSRRWPAGSSRHRQRRQGAAIHQVPERRVLPAIFQNIFRES